VDEKFNLTESMRRGDPLKHTITLPSTRLMNFAEICGDNMITMLGLLHQL
jgi:hypothetical protein